MKNYTTTINAERGTGENAFDKQIIFEHTVHAIYGMCTAQTPLASAFLHFVRFFIQVHEEKVNGLKTFWQSENITVVASIIIISNSSDRYNKDAPTDHTVWEKDNA